MTTYPSRQDYQIAIMAADKLLRVPALVGGRFEPDDGGVRPKIWSGGFAAVFRCTDRQGRNWALRCPTRDLPGGDRQYAAVHAYFAQSPADYLVDFGYFGKGIFAKGNLHPVSVSAWIDGLDIKRFIQRHGVSRELLDEWHRVIRDMHARGIAHGDLQHENILIQGSPRRPSIRLVDYDSFVVPANIGHPEPIAGVAHYQHPLREVVVSTKDRRVDAFSLLVIELSLVAIAANPAAWPELQHDNCDGLLLGQRDLHDPASSPIFDRLRRCGGRVSELCAALEMSLASSDPLACAYPWELRPAKSAPHSLPGWMRPAGQTLTASAPTHAHHVPTVAPAPVAVWTRPPTSVPSWMQAPAVPATQQPRAVAASPRPVAAPNRAASSRFARSMPAIAVTLAIMIGIVIGVVFGLIN